MSPVAAGICIHPAEYRWSSCSSELDDQDYPWLDFDLFYLGLGKNASERRKRYGEFLQTAASEQERATIRLAVQRGQLSGGEHFVDEIEKKLNLRI